MAKVAAGITTSVDGYITGPNDGPERGLGEGGERLHYWVFGGPCDAYQVPSPPLNGSTAAAKAGPTKSAKIAGPDTWEDRSRMRRMIVNNSVTPDGVMSTTGVVIATYRAAEPVTA
jgi:hypothetical protein